MAEALRVGIAGLGTVGASVARVLAEKAAELTRQCGREIIVTAVSARDATRDRGVDLSSAKWFADPVELARSADIDVFVELIGGEEGPARASVTAALEAGRHVVTANKALLARHGVELAEIAEGKGILLNYEAAVAGGIPVIKTMREAMAGNTVSRVFGILNGTCNYILTRMEAEGLSFEDCLKDAQRLGYAEADPTFDIEGNDTAHKLSILTSLAFGNRIAAGDIYLEGISNITQADIRAAGCRPAHGKRHRAARAPDHGADGVRHRAGSRRHQRRCDRDGHSGRTAAFRPRRRRQRDGFRRCRRHRRYSQEPPGLPAWPGLWPAREGIAALPEGAHALACRRLLHPPYGP
jgi:homoserine dehydrogenase